MRCAINSGCSMKFDFDSMTPGIMILPSGSLICSNGVHSCAWRGFAASNEIVASRHDFTLPEKQGHMAPIEVACRIGKRLFAFEHTRIEPFEGQIRLQADAPEHFNPVAERLAGILSPDTLLL